MYVTECTLSVVAVCFIDESSSFPSHTNLDVPEFDQPALGH